MTTLAGILVSARGCHADASRAQEAARERADLDEVRRRYVYTAVRGIVSFLCETAAAPPGSGTRGAATAPNWAGPGSVDVPGEREPPQPWFTDLVGEFTEPGPISRSRCEPLENHR